MRARLVSRASLAAAASVSTTGWWALPKGSKTLPLTATAISTAAAETGTCTGLSADDIANLIAFYSMLLGRQITEEELCGSSDGGSGDPADPVPGDGLASVEFTSILLKDSCRALRNSFYLIKLELDLSQVTRSAEQNITIQTKVTARKYSGGKQSTLKPVSEGRFAPAPLLLMRALSGGYYGSVSEKMYLNKWRNGLPKKNLAIRVPQYLYYRGMIFAEGLPGGYLSGGRATATLSNDTTGYSLCLSLDRRRQKFYGYP